MAGALRYRPPVTLPELDEIERESGLRHELVDGIAYAMVGGTADHGAIVAGIVIALGRRLAMPCQVFSESTRLLRKTDIADDVFYPDVMVSCDPADRAKGHREHPVILVEVLSPSSSHIDRGRKQQLYQALPSLEHYLIVAQTHGEVECFDRANGWEPVRFGLADEIAFPSLSITVPVREFYAQVDFQE